MGFRYPLYWEFYWDYWRDPFLYAKLTASKDNCPGSQRHKLPPTDMHADGKPLVGGTVVFVGLYRDNGKENGNHRVYIGVILDSF